MNRQSYIVYLLIFVVCFVTLSTTLLCSLHLLLLHTFRESPAIQQSLRNIKYPLPFIFDIQRLTESAVESYMDLLPASYIKESAPGYAERLQFIVWIQGLLFSLFVHELGHYWCAKKNNVRVHGFGFKLWSASLFLMVDQEDLGKAKIESVVSIYSGGIFFNVIQTVLGSLFTIFVACIGLRSLLPVLYVMAIACPCVLIFFNAIPIFGLDGHALITILVGKDSSKFCSAIFLAMTLFNYLVYPVLLKGNMGSLFPFLSTE